MLALGDIGAAQQASHDLDAIAAGHDGGALTAIAAATRGAVALASGEAASALVSLRRALSAWHALEAPYEAARVRVLIGRACAALGDADAASRELDAARAIFERLEAAPDLARIAPPDEDGPAEAAFGLTPRELEVLRLVATGVTNKAIAMHLTVSERTIDRHVSNIFTKLRVTSRAAATAVAYQRQLVPLSPG
jgi:DNA-binding NarL/FixJ family response regulator